MKYLGYLLLAFSPFSALAQPGQAVCPPGTLCNPLKDVGSLGDFISIILNKIVLPIGSIVVVLFIIYSGFLFVTARGNESKLEEAKHTLLYVVIGTAVLLGAAVIAAVINGTLCQIAPSLPNCP